MIPSAESPARWLWWGAIKRECGPDDDDDENDNAIRELEGSAAWSKIAYLCTRIGAWLYLCAIGPSGNVRMRTRKDGRTRRTTRPRRARTLNKCRWTQLQLVSHIQSRLVKGNLLRTSIWMQCVSKVALCAFDDDWDVALCVRCVFGWDMAFGSSTCSFVHLVTQLRNISRNRVGWADHMKSTNGFWQISSNDLFSKPKQGRTNIFNQTLK